LNPGLYFLPSFLDSSQFLIALEEFPSAAILSYVNHLIPGKWKWLLSPRKASKTKYEIIAQQKKTWNQNVKLSEKSSLQRVNFTPFMYLPARC